MFPTLTKKKKLTLCISLWMLGVEIFFSIVYLTNLTETERTRQHTSKKKKKEKEREKKKEERQTDRQTDRDRERRTQTDIDRQTPANI